MKSNYFSKFSNCYIIAEVGVNHNGNIDLAKENIIEAKKAGANAVKFQTFAADRLVSKDTPKVKYQEVTSNRSETHFEMIKSLELSEKSHHILFEFCKKSEIDFISTPYDVGSVDFLFDLGVCIFKTASADITDIPMHEHIATLKKPVMIATGMASLAEIEHVISVYESKEAVENIMLLHCVSNYPCSASSLNLHTLKTLSTAFGVPVGYSDHSLGNIASILSVAMGAKVVEKHFTLSKELPGPDHRASSTPSEFKSLVEDIRSAELMLGDYRKKIQPEEMQMAEVSRKSIFIDREMKKGEVIGKNDLCCLRPGNGIKPKHLKALIGRVVKRNLRKSDQLQWKDISD